MQVALDALSWVVLLPCSVCLACELRGHGRSSVRAFCIVFSVAAILYPTYNALVDVPMYLEREGLLVALVKREVAALLGSVRT